MTPAQAAALKELAEEYAVRLADTGYTSTDQADDARNALHRAIDALTHKTYQD